MIWSAWACAQHRGYCFHASGLEPQPANQYGVHLSVGMSCETGNAAYCATVRLSAPAYGSLEQPPLRLLKGRLACSADRPAPNSFFRAAVLLLSLRQHSSGGQPWGSRPARCRLAPWGLNAGSLLEPWQGQG